MANNEWDFITNEGAEQFAAKLRAKPRLAVDFDGTIWDGKELLPGCLEKLVELHDTHSIVVYSARQTEHERQQMKAILDANSVPYDEILPIKEQYDILIDDKAVKFESWYTVSL